MCTTFYPPSPRTRPMTPNEDVIADWLELREQGLSRHDAAIRLGYPDRRGLDKAICRAYHSGLLERP